MPDQRRKKSRIFRLTSWGKAMLLFAAVMLLAALTTGRNLIYLVFSLLLSFMVVSAIMATISLYGLEIARLFPQHIFAGKPFLVQTKVTNRKRLFPSFSLTVNNILGDRELNGRYILKLPRLSGVSLAHKYLIPKRGAYTFQGVRVATTYPPEFFLKGYAVIQPETIIVYPRIIRLSSRFLDAMLSEVEHPVNRAGLGTDLYGFRKYQNGDDSRFINWKLSAKTSDLLVTKYCHEQSLKVCIVLDNLMHSTDESSREKFESAVSLAASLCSFFIERGFKVKFASRNEEIPFDEGKKQLYRILRHLALIEPTTGQDARVDIYSPNVVESATGLLVRCEGKPSAPRVPAGRAFSLVLDGAMMEGV